MSVKRVYFRIEDPTYPLSIGLLLPSLEVKTCDKDWTAVEKSPVPCVMFKQIEIKDFSIFINPYHKQSFENENLRGLDAMLDILPKEWSLEKKLQHHLAETFKLMDSGEKNEVTDNFILDRFKLGLRITLVQDRKEASKAFPSEEPPDMGLSLILGSLFTQAAEEVYQVQGLEFKLKESQWYALSHFGSYNGMFNHFRFGVLSPFYQQQS